MNKLTLAELRLKQATLAEKAERLTATWRTLPSGAKSQAMHKEIKSLTERANDYYGLIKMAERLDGAAVRKMLLDTFPKEAS